MASRGLATRLGYASAPMARSIHLVSLGCPKNRVDSEVMLGVAERAGYEHTSDAASAEVIVVNTCGFIEPAKKESIDTILELAEHKKTGSCQKLVVTGCLSQRHSAELAEGLPEVDHFLGSSDMLRIAEALAEGADRMLVGNPADWIVRATDPRVVSTRGASAYLKLAEGCSRTCSFCVIPQLRGRQRSRRPDDVVDEARRLVEAGVLELNLVSQDTVAYGRDLDGRVDLSTLVEAVAAIDGAAWVRLFYLYPEKLSDRLIALIAEHPRVVPYIDMPLQHAADAMLRRMRRGHGGRRLYDLVERLRREVDGLVFRSAFIVGHPGETEDEFRQLCDFVEWARFDHVGVFRYSDEDTCLSTTFDHKVEPEIAAERVAELMEIQRGISAEKNAELVGRDIDVLVEGPSSESELVMEGRHAGQAPDIDGSVFVGGGLVQPSAIYRARVTQSSDYDLVADVHCEDPAPIAVARRARARHPMAHRPSDGRRVSLRTVP